MHWHLALALLLTVLACSARSECQAYADLVRRLDNGGTGIYKAKAKLTVKVQGDAPPPEKNYLEGEISKGVSFMGIGGSESVSVEQEVARQVSRISKREWTKMAERSMEAWEEFEEEYQVPPRHKIFVFQVRLVCGRYEMSLSKDVMVLESI